MDLAIMVCPDCDNVPCFYKGCSNCGSSETSFNKFIHHYACANVDTIAAYSVNDIIQCPKCLMKSLIVNRDFEIVQGPNVCKKCNWIDSKLSILCYCSICDTCFPSDNCKEKKIDVKRINSLVIPKAQ